MDVAILVPLKEEFDQLYPDIAKGCGVEKDTRTQRSFYTFSRLGMSGRQYRCVTTFVGEMGEKEAASLTRMIVERYSPGTIVLLGIAGDVVIADQIDDYMAAAKAESGGKLEFHLAGKDYRPDVRILNTIRYFEYDHPAIYQRLTTEGQGDLRSLNEHDFQDLLSSNLVSNKLNLHWGPVASGDIVSASVEFSRWLLGRNRKYRAIEMEAAGVMGEIYQSAGDEKVAVLRGISDCADERKAKLDAINGGSLRVVAMRNVIRVLWALFEVDAFEHHLVTAPPAEQYPPKFPKTIEQAREMLAGIEPAELKELEEIVLVLEILSASTSHFERHDFLLRAKKLSASPVVIPENIAEGLRDFTAFVQSGELSWTHRMALKATAPIWRREVNKTLATTAGITENTLWQRLLSRNQATAAAFLICTLYDIRAGVVSEKIEPLITKEFHVRQWPLPSM